METLWRVSPALDTLASGAVANNDAVAARHQWSLDTLLSNQAEEAGDGDFDDDDLCDMFLIDDWDDELDQSTDSSSSASTATSFRSLDSSQPLKPQILTDFSV
jgi:hypothetical protein